MKYFLYFLLCLTNILAINVVNAQDAKLVKHGQWGSSQYLQMVELNDHYYVLKEHSKTIDVINPLIEGSGSLLGQFSFPEGVSHTIQSIDKYNGYLVVLTRLELFIYSVNNVTEFSLEYTANVRSHLGETENMYILDDIYLLSEDNKIHIFGKSDTDFIDKGIIEPDPSFDFLASGLNITAQNLIIANNNAYKFSIYADNESYAQFLQVEAYDIVTHELISSKKINDDIYNIQVLRSTYTGSDRFVLRTDDFYFTVKFDGDNIDKLDNFDEFNQGWEIDFQLNYHNNKLWAVGFHGYLSSFSFDEEDKVTRHMYQRVREDKPSTSGFDALDLTWVGEKLVLISKPGGITEITIDEQLLSIEVSPLYYEGGRKGRGIFIDDVYYIPTNYEEEISALELPTVDNIHVIDKTTLNEIPWDIFKLPHGYLINSYTGLSMYQKDESGQFQLSSHANMTMPTIYDFNEKFLFYAYWENSLPGIFRVDISTLNSLEQPSLFVQYPESICSASQKVQIIGDDLIVIDQCVDDTIHLFSDIGSDGFAYNKKIEINLSVTSDFATIDDYLYIYDSQQLRVASINNENELMINTAINVESIGLTPLSINIVQEKLIAVFSQGVYIYDVSTPLSPKFLAKTGDVEAIYNPNFSSNSAKFSFANDIVATTSAYEGSVKFFKLNFAPTLSHSDFEVSEDELLIFPQLHTDPESDDVSISIADDATNGLVTVEPQLSYQANEDFFGEDSFMIKVEDIHGNFIESEISVSILAVDDLPIADSISKSVSHNGTSSDSLATTDRDGDSLSYSLVNDVTSGILTLSASGEYSYTANTGFVGTDSFTYQVSDGLNSVQGTITFSVQAAPTIIESNKESSGGGSFGILLLVSLMLLILCQAKQKVRTEN